MAPDVVAAPPASATASSASPSCRIVMPCRSRSPRSASCRTGRPRTGDLGGSLDRPVRRRRRRAHVRMASTAGPARHRRGGRRRRARPVHAHRWRLVHATCEPHRGGRDPAASGGGGGDYRVLYVGDPRVDPVPVGRSRRRRRDGTSSTTARADLARPLARRRRHPPTTRSATSCVSLPRAAPAAAAACSPRSASASWSCR